GGDSHTAVTLAADAWSSDRGVHMCRGTAPADAVGESTLTLTVAGHVVERRGWPGGQGVRSVSLGAYEIYDPGLSILREWLHAEVRPGRARKDRPVTVVQKRFEYA